MISTRTSNERRRYRRVAYPIPLIYNFEVDDGIGGKRVECAAQAEDISAGGVSILVASELPPSAEITIKMPVRTMTIRCRGRVIRNERMPRNDAWRVAIALELAERDRVILLDYLAERKMQFRN